MVFTRSDGTLASLRASEVDLEASRRVTAESLLPKEVPQSGAAGAEAPRKKLAVITDKDLPRRAPAPAAPAEATLAAPAAPVTVSNYRRQVMPGGEGLLILGTLQNLTSSTASNLTLQVSLTDAKGALLASAPGLFPTRILAPKGAVEFRATFPGIVEFSGVKFDAGGWVPETPKPETGEDHPEGAPPPPGPAQG